MRFERGGRKYELLFGSDIDRDTFFLELRDVTEGEAGVVVLFGEKDEEGEYRFLVHGYDALWDEAVMGTNSQAPIFLPLELVEDFVAWMKDRL